mmetsp:Transcript_2761/g.7684  ORF Transcript_2761/g.7684 Transcript_2761/m.7684 type:complete len:212 (-) Transcript_2761:262-897(-)
MRSSTVAAAMLLLLGESEALRTPPSAAGTGSMHSSRRALLVRTASAAGAASSLLFTEAPAASANDKGYLTLSEYQAIKAQEKKDEALYGLFEQLRNRASQTGEFDALAEKDDMKGLSQLALAWDSNIRQQVLDKASKELKGADQDTAKSLSKKVLDDLKQIDKLAKAGTKAEVPDISKALRGHVLEFVALTPKKLAEKYGVGDMGGELGDL